MTSFTEYFDFTSMIEENYRHSPAATQTEGVSDNAGMRFADLLARFSANAQKLQDISTSLASAKAQLQADALDIILRRVQGTRNGDSTDNARWNGELQNVSSWFSRNSAAKNSFLETLSSMSVFQPETVRNLVHSMDNLRQSIAAATAAVNISTVNYSAVFSQVTSWELTSEAGMDDAAVAAFTGTSRITVKMQIQMQAVTQGIADQSLLAGERTRSTISVFGQQLDLQAYLQYIDPIVLDLEGDGIALSELTEDGGVVFDLAGNGRQQRCGFVQGDDALLFLDRDNDGLCGNGRELFGNQEGHQNGFAKLLEYDSNGDGVIDENDAVYDDLKTWTDTNGDGICTADEVRDLRSSGVQSINLGYQQVAEENNGNLITEKSFYTTLNGAVHAAVDAQFRCVPA